VPASCIKMEFQKVLDNRHSIREFEKKSIPKLILKRLILNAAKAPSASNRQPWKFYVVCSEDKIEKIRIYLKESLKILNKDILKKPKRFQKIISKFYNNMGNCQNIIFIFRKKYKNEPVHFYYNDIASISCAAENLMLSATNKKLGTCWVGSFKNPKTENKIKKLIKAEKNEELISSILIGYPKGDYIPLIRKKKRLNEVLKFI